MSEPTLEEQLFFGSVEVTFEVTPGSAFWSPSGAWKDVVSEQAKAVANARFFPVQSMGEEYSDLIVPAIPATDLCLCEHTGN